MTEKPIISAAQAAAMIPEGAVLHVGGFMGCGSPPGILAAILARGVKGMTLVCNDTAVDDPKTGTRTGIAPLVRARLFRGIVTSHIGMNAETQRQMNSGETEVELVPQGSLAERVRAAGAGLGGVLTPTGVGTEVELGKLKLTVKGRSFLLEEPLPGDVAVLKAKRADRAGNLQYAKTARNFNPLMATACRLVIAEVEEIVEIGVMDPDQVHTPSIFVDFLVHGESEV